MRALICLDTNGKVRVISSDDWWLHEVYSDLVEDTLDVDRAELDFGKFYLWTGKSQLTYPCPLDGVSPDGSELVRSKPLEDVTPTAETLARFTELLSMSPSEEECDTTPPDTIWD